MTSTFDLRIVVAPPKEAKTLTPTEHDALFRKPEIAEKKEKKAGTLPRAELLDAKAEDPSFTLEQISEGYSELIDKANGLLETLKTRVGDFTYEFDPQKNPSLSEAVAETFQGEYERVTYQMYLAALRLDKDIAVAIGEASHGVK